MTTSPGPQALAQTSSSETRRALRRFGLFLVLGNIAIDALLAVIGTAVLVPSRADDELRARQAVENLAATLSSEIGSELRQVDNALLAMAQLHRSAKPQSAAGAALVEGALLAYSGLLPQADTLRITDAQGRVTLPREAGPIQVGDRDYFRQARLSDRMVFSAPLLDRVSARWSIVVARRLLAPDGSFAGVVFAALTVQHFQSLFGRLELGASGAVTLRNDALQLIARHPAVDTAATRELGSSNVSDELRAALARNRERGWFAATTRLDGVERLTAYQAVGDYPLLLLAGLAKDDFMRDWRRQRVWLSGLLGLVALLLAAFSAASCTQRRRQTRTTLALARLAREQAAMLNNELVGMARVRGRHAIWKNRALERIFGYAEGELDGHATRSLYLDDASYDMVGNAYAALARDGRFRTQLQMRRKDGSPVWIDLSGAPVTEDESLWMLVDITALKTSEEHLKHLALHDPLTQLPNRTLFSEQLELMLANARRSGDRIAVCLLDLDGFKPVNDSYGHEAGDQVLREVAARLQQCMRQGDVVARIGGDEFAMALGGLKETAELGAILARVLQAIGAPLRLGSGLEAGIGASIGAALAPDQAGDIVGLLRLADAALYLAKRSGRNRACLSGSDRPLAEGAAAA